MNPYHPHARRDRGRLATIGLFAILAALSSVFFRAQVLGYTEFADVGRQNRIRNLDLPAPRGMIFDRAGRLIADNAPGYGIAVLPAPSDTIRARLERLREVIPISDERIERVIADASVSRFEPVWVLEDASFEEVSAVEERRSEFPDLYLEVRPRRRYHGGASLGPLVGYIGEVDRNELDSVFVDDPRYAGGVIVGKTGIEKQYETLLQGTRGNRYVEVDARSRIVGDFAGIEDRAPQPGQDITLTLDLELQEYIHSIFPDSMSGAVVAIDPADGSVLALYSAPSYDPNVFVGGISTEEWAALRGGDGNPLFNKAVQGTYAPASTFKLATAAIALEMGVVRPDEHMPQPCTGYFAFGNTVKRCWNRDGHGDISLLEAIRDSCDVYYYQLGLRVGLRNLLEAGNRLGFSDRCGIDLPSETPGSFPRSEQFWVDRFGYRPTEGETLNLIIGQGANDQTPLKMAQFYTAIARDGSAPAPRLYRDRDPDEAAGWELDLSDDAIEVMREGLRQVTANGTARNAALELWDFIGKSGTGENARSQAGLAFDDAWFASIAGPWGEDPEIVVVVLIVEGDSGSGAAAPIAAKSADFYLRGKYGIPRTDAQTVRERFNRGIPTPWAYQRRDPEVWRGAHLRARARLQAEAARAAADSALAANGTGRDR